MLTGLMLALSVFLAGCDEGILNAITRAEHPYPLKTPTIISQFHTTDPQSQLQFVGWRELWPGVHQDVVRVTEAFVERPQAVISEEIRGWSGRFSKGRVEYVNGQWELIERLPDENQGQDSSRTYHVRVYLDRQPNVLVAKGDWDGSANQIYVEVYRASDIPPAR